MAKPKKTNSPDGWQWMSRGVYRAPWEDESAGESWQIRQASSGAYFVARFPATNTLELKALDEEHLRWARRMRSRDSRATAARWDGRTARVGRPRGVASTANLHVRVAPEIREMADRIADKLDASLPDVVTRGLKLLAKKEGC